jgi:transposase-like protein
MWWPDDPLEPGSPGLQHFRCKDCGRTTTAVPPRPLAPMRLPFDRAVLLLRLLVEGMSIRSAERITGHHRDTIMRLLALAERKAERLLEHLGVRPAAQRW